MTEDEINRDLCQKITRHIQLDGKTILEVGCGAGSLLRMIADEFRPESIVGVDPMLRSWWNTGASSGKNWRVMDGDAEALAFADSSFDAVFSIATFEHIGDVKQALREIKRVLRPRGRFYTSFSPLWTSVAGHHFVAPEDSYWNPEHLAAIPPWGHLYMDETEMERHLERRHTPPKLAKQILSFIYRSNIINRRSRSELAGDLFDSGMIVRHYREYPAFNRLSMFPEEPRMSELSADIVGKIKAAGACAVFDLGIIGIEACLEKFQAIA